MPASVRFTGKDDDMTLDELADFVEHARIAKVPKNNPIHAEVSTTGKLQLVEVLLELDDS